MVVVSGACTTDRLELGMVAQLDGQWGEAIRFAPGQVKLRFLDWPCSDEGQGEGTKADRPRESRYVQQEQGALALLLSRRRAALLTRAFLTQSAGSVVCSLAGS